MQRTVQLHLLWHVGILLFGLVVFGPLLVLAGQHLVQASGQDTSEATEASTEVSEASEEASGAAASAVQAVAHPVGLPGRVVGNVGLRSEKPGGSHACYAAVMGCQIRGNYGEFVETLIGTIC